MTSTRPWTEEESDEIWERMNHKTGFLSTNDRDELAMRLGRARGAINSEVNRVRVKHDIKTNLSSKEIKKIKQQLERRAMKPSSVRKSGTTNRAKPMLKAKRAQFRLFLDWVIAEAAKTHVSVIIYDYLQVPSRILRTLDEDARKALKIMRWAYEAWVPSNRASVGLIYTDSINNKLIVQILQESKYRDHFRFRNRVNGIPNDLMEHPKGEPTAVAAVRARRQLTLDDGLERMLERRIERALQGFVGLTKEDLLSAKEEIKAVVRDEFRVYNRKLDAVLEVRTLERPAPRTEPAPAPAPVSVAPSH